MKFLLATWEGGGVIPPELGIARRLRARGHGVHVISDSAVESAALAADCSFSPWERAPNKRSLLPEDDVLRDWEFKNPLALFEHALEVFFAGPQGRFAADVLAAIERERPDCVLADFAIMGAVIAAESRRLPCAMLVPNIYMCPTPGIPPIGPGWRPARGPLGRMRDALMRALSNRVWKKGLPAINQARADNGLEPVDAIWSIYDRADAVLVLTSHAFDFEAERLPANVRYVGPVLDDPSWAADWTSPWSEDDRRPLVLVGLSSTFQDQVATLGRVIDALAGQPLRALVTLGPALAPDAVRSPAPNVLVVPTVPHSAVIPRAAAVLTHCGHGTTMRALSAGVPLVCMPMGRDQNDTAARVVERGAGVRIKPSASPAAIRAAVAEVIGDARYREAAQRLARAIALESAGVDLIGDLEALAAKRTRQPAAQLTA